ncbi:MAG: disulfide bond chaperone [Verrucomicrobia bacterium]|nr:disulfide bond chaperone [Verrucomicrobiota bacterium]
MESPAEFTKIESIFVRHRNALLVRGQFTPLYTDYYLHLLQHAIRHAAELDQMLKDALAVLALHLVARPWAETLAWTVNLRVPRLNLFVTGGSLTEAVTGRIFTEDVREPEHNFFYSQTTTLDGAEPSLSTMEVTGTDPVRWLSRYYEQSEQRPARAFRLGDEHFALVAAQPDCELAWLAALDETAVCGIEIREETTLLETRRFRFHCGCSLERILPILGGWKNRPDELFHDASSITIQCPRCAARFSVTRAMLTTIPEPERPAPRP